VLERILELTVRAGCAYLKRIYLSHIQAVGLIDYEDHPTEGLVAAIRNSIRVNKDTLPRRAPGQPRGADTRCWRSWGILPWKFKP
jgi:hypothetical protein